MGTSNVPLGRLYDSAREVIEGAGGHVRLGASVSRIEGDGGRVTGVSLSNGERLLADSYISALPFDRLDKVMDDSLRGSDERFDGLDQFEHSPILGIHLWFKPEVMKHEHLVLVDSPLQWVFNKGLNEEGCQYLHGVISAAHEWVDVDSDEILKMAVHELGFYVPKARESGALARGRVIKEKRATFSPRPGIEAFRPVARGDVGNLYLAGDWTASGWPATMEGAARSGYEAAGAVLSANPGAYWEPPLKPSLCYRAIAVTGSR
ncbi:MAG: hydroxysqualene dehydroxylase, partial [Planctomycetota bacterium]|jgi:zeta-carotene desaturase